MKTFTTILAALYTLLYTNKCFAVRDEKRTTRHLFNVDDPRMRQLEHEHCDTKWDCICDSNSGLGTQSNIVMEAVSEMTTDTSNTLASYSHSHDHSDDHSHSHDDSSSSSSHSHSRSSYIHSHSYHYSHSHSYHYGHSHSHSSSSTHSHSHTHSSSSSSSSSLSIDDSDDSAAEELQYLVQYDISGMSTMNCTDCVLSIHEGSTCSDAFLVGETFSNKDLEDYDRLLNPEGAEIAVNSGVAFGNFKMDNGYGYQDNLNRTIVVFDSAGERIACGVLEVYNETIPSLVAKMGNYPLAIYYYEEDDWDIGGNVYLTFSESSRGDVDSINSGESVNWITPDPRASMFYSMSGLGNTDCDKGECELSIHGKRNYHESTFIFYRTQWLIIHNSYSSLII